jgi:hypothetical protein
MYHSHNLINNKLRIRKHDHMAGLISSDPLGIGQGAYGLTMCLYDSGPYFTLSHACFRT